MKKTMERRKPWEDGNVTSDDWERKTQKGKNEEVEAGQVPQVAEEAEAEAAVLTAKAGEVKVRAEAVVEVGLPVLRLIDL